MPPLKTKSSTSQVVLKATDNAVSFVTLLASAPYYILFRRGTYEPIKRILDTGTDADACTSLQKWSRYKAKEAGYVQVAGAVAFSAVVGCPSWPIAVDSHWTGPALWYASLIFAVCAILTGAQQTLYLGAGGVMSEPTSLEIAHTRLSLTSRSDHRQPSALVVFAWQVPVMLLCWSILCFLAGLCCVIYSPLSQKLRWNSDSKTALLFSIAALACLLAWATASLVVFRLRLPGQFNVGDQSEDIERSVRQALK